MFGFNAFTRPTRDWREATAAYHQMILAANEVVWRRSLQMMTGTMSAGEATRMVFEKPATFASAAQLAGLAATTGASPGKIAGAAVKPLSKKAQSNARRLRG